MWLYIFWSHTIALCGKQNKMCYSLKLFLMLSLRFGHMCRCLLNFRMWNPIISVGIHTIWNSARGRKISKCRFCGRFKLAYRFTALTYRKLIEIDFCVSSTSYIATLVLTTDKKNFLPTKLSWNFANVTAPLEFMRKVVMSDLWMNCFF